MKKGNYPFAVLHAYRTSGLVDALEYAMSISKEEMTKREAINYVRDVVKTSGHPDLIDLYS